MRVLLSVHHELALDTGAPGATLQLADALRAAGHEVSVYSWDELPARLPARARELLFGAFLCAHLVRLRGAARPEVLDAMTGDAWPWLWLRGAGGPALLSRAHGLEHRFYEQFEGDARRRGVRLGMLTRAYHGHVRLWEVTRSLRRAELSLFLNDADRMFAVERLGVDPAHARVVANGVSQALLDAGRLLPGPGDGPPRIAVVGSWAERKGIDYGVPALDTLLASHPALRVTLLGTGAGASEVTARFAPGVRDRVEVTSSYRRDELPALLRGCHINLFPTLAEGQSLALLETMACGLVAVTTPAGGGDVIRDATNGLIVPARDVGALVAAVQRLLDDRALLERLREGALDAAATRSWAAAAQRAGELYAEALALRSRASR